MQKTKKFIEEWHQIIINQKLELLDNILDDNVVFSSPVVFSPLEGKSITKMYLFAAGKAFNMSNFRYTREVHDEHNSILEFETLINGISVNGVDMIEWNKDGKIIDFKVMIRPYKAVQVVKEKMMEMLETIKD